jgi:hypothetical protein
MNRATRIITATLGIVFAIGGMSHGFFEVLQGNTPTNGYLIDAISPERQTWAYGGEAAFTLIPNFLYTGIAALAVSFAIVIWSLGFVHTRHGPTVFLLLFIALVLVGGGIGQIAFFTLGWAFATRMNKPLTWWRRVLPEGARRIMARIWPYTLVLGTLPILLALEIAIFGYLPGITDDDVLLTIVFSLLGSSLLLYAFTYVAGYAYDIEQQTVMPNASS